MARRLSHELRPLKATPHYLAHPEGSVLIEFGATKVLCTASCEDKVPPWLVGRGQGWLTAEYDMLPRATSTRSARASERGKVNGRAQEISRLIGRALRGVVNFKALGERTIIIDCDVLQADGGTRTAAITGGYIALALALQCLAAKGALLNPTKTKGGKGPDEIKEEKLLQPAEVLKDAVAAVSVGLVEGEMWLDLDYLLDAHAEVDLNVIMTGSGQLIEVQGTAEKRPFSRDELTALVDLAFRALPALRSLQEAALKVPLQETLSSVSVLPERA